MDVLHYDYMDIEDRATLDAKAENNAGDCQDMKEWSMLICIPSWHV